MADKRKLCAEIDRTLKKVTEGLDTFEDFWQKLNQSSNANQKEKLEADMKKEIKKLQRLRDQLKLWLVSPDIKDKQVLMEARKNIETQMEKFKAIERETKTKAYSKEGLVATGKVDPKEKEKEDILTWISNAIANLNQQYEKFESESEALLSRKKKLDKEDATRLEFLQSTMEQHKFHNDKLEAILRLVDNSAVQFEKIQSIRENVEYYVESNHEPDFLSNDTIYDELELDELNSTLKSDITAALSASECDNESAANLQLNTASSLPLHHHKSKDDDGKKRQKNLDDLTYLSQNKNAPKTSQSVSFPSNRPMQTPTKVNPVSAQITQSTSHKSTTVSNSGLGYAQVAGKLVANSPSKTSSNVINGMILTSGVNNNFQSFTSLPQSSVPTAVVSTASTPLESSQLSELTSAMSLLNNNTNELCSISAFTSCTSSSISHELNSFVNGSRGAFPGTDNLMHNKWLPVGETKKDNLFNGTTMANGFVDSALHQGNVNQDLFLKVMNSDIAPATSIPSNLESNVMNGNADDEVLGSDHMNGESQSPHSFGKTSASGTCSVQTIHLEPIYSVSPLGYAPLSEEQILNKMSLEASSNCLPLPCDSEKVRVYLPNNPCTTPPYYPIALPAVMQVPEFFNKLEPDTLFFVFYYMEGTKAQYQAAKALKQKSWRFHTKYMMWFQRHEEPKQITDEFEQGTYIFFDFEKWIQRKKEGFKFEYRYLEDHELI